MVFLKEVLNTIGQFSGLDNFEWVDSLQRRLISESKDFEKAAYWYKKSAEQGNSRAQYNLAKCYENGEGVVKDYEQAVYWYTQAAEQGDADAQNNLGLMYENGAGVEKNLEKAIYWYQQAAELGDANAQCNLGQIYYFEENFN